MGEEDRGNAAGCVLEDLQEESICWGGVYISDADALVVLGYRDMWSGMEWVAARIGTLENCS